MTSSQPEADLVRQALAGQRSAYAILARKWSARVMAVCHARVGCADTAEDLTQETLLRGLRALPTLRDPQRFGQWICGIARCTCLDWLKARARTQVSSDSLDTRAADPDDTAARAGRVAEMLQAVEMLPESCREVVMLYYYHDFTYEELAALLGVSPATINARLTRARALLRDRLATREVER